MSRRPALITQAVVHGRDPLDPDIARLVEGIALTLAAEHHALEVAQGLPCRPEMGSDGSSSHRPF